MEMTDFMEEITHRPNCREQRFVLPLRCVKCGRETKTPARCHVCQMEDEMNAGPALFGCLKHLTETDWFRDDITVGAVICALDPDKVRSAVARALGQNVHAWAADNSDGGIDCK